MENEQESLVEEFINANAEVNPVSDSAETTGAADQSTESADTSELVSDPMPEAEEEGEAETAPSEISDSEGQSANEESGAPKRTFSNRKFKKLEHENRELKRKFAELERRFNERTAVAEAPKAEEAPVKPTRSNFASDDEFYEAMSHWQLLKANAEQAEIARKQQAEAAKYDAWSREWSAKLQRNFTTPDVQREYTELAKENQTLVQMVGIPLAQYIYSLEDGPKVQMYLWKHPTATAKLASAHPFDQAEMLRNIRSFVGRKTESNKPAGKPVNVAQPRPFGSAGIGGRNPSVSVDSAKAEDVFDMLSA